MLRTLLLKASQSRWLAHQATQRRFAQRAVRRFMPGEDVTAALDAAQNLAAQGMPTVLTYLGENVEDAAEAHAVGVHYLDVLDRIAARSLPCHLSVKPTQLGLDLGEAICALQLDRLATHARAAGTMVWVDMEGSPYTDVTVRLYRSLRERHDNVGLCLQAYLHRTERDLASLLPMSPSIRLVKGAYREPPSVAFARKRDVDASFLALARRILGPAGLRDGAIQGIATHDPTIIDAVRRHAADTGVPADAYEFQMLYGIRREAQRRLVEAGQRVRVLISYGEAWFPWYMRRLAERPANLLFVMRSLVNR